MNLSSGSEHLPGHREETGFCLLAGGVSSVGNDSTSADPRLSYRDSGRSENERVQVGLGRVAEETSVVIVED